MKKIFKNLLIFIVSILIALTMILVSCTSLAFNKEEIKTAINKSNIYKEMNRMAKEEAIKVLDEALVDVNKEYNLDIHASDLLSSIDISDLFELVTNEVIDIAYSTDPPKIVINYLTNRYLEKVENYFKDNGLAIPDEIMSEIKNALSEDTLNKIVDDAEIETALLDVQKTHKELESNANAIVLLLIIIAGIPTLLIIIFSKKKIKEIVKILFLTSLFLALFELFVKGAIKNVETDLGELLLSIFNSTTSLVFDKLHMFLVAMIVLMVMLIIIKIVFTKTPKEIEEEKKEEEEKEKDKPKSKKVEKKVDEEGKVVSAFDKF